MMHSNQYNAMHTIACTHVTVRSNWQFSNRLPQLKHVWTVTMGRLSDYIVFDKNKIIDII